MPRVKKAEPVKESTKRSASGESESEVEAKAPKLARSASLRTKPVATEVVAKETKAPKVARSASLRTKPADPEMIEKGAKATKLVRSASVRTKRVASDEAGASTSPPIQPKVAPLHDKKSSPIIIQAEKPKVQKKRKTTEDTGNRTKQKATKAAVQPEEDTIEEEEEDIENPEELVTPINISDTNNNKNSRAKASKMTLPAKRLKSSILPRQSRGAGTILVFGMGDTGQLGFEAERRKYPALIPFFQGKKVIEVGAGGMHTVVLTDKGEVFTFGCNDEKVLGRHTEEEEDEREAGQVELPKNIVQISAGDSHSAALTEDGQVYAWGTFRDINGAMGLVPGGGEILRVTPELISNNISARITKIVSGAHHLVMLTEDGTVFTCGTRDQGQLGRVQPTESARVTRHMSTIPRLNEKDFCLTPMEIQQKRKKFTDIWAGNYSTYCKTSKGDVWVCGLNNYKQLGVDEDGDTIIDVRKSPGLLGKKWKQLSAGEHHVLALDSDGKVYALGRPDDSRLGLDLESNSAVDKPTLIPTLADKTCVQVACGLSVSYALTEEGHLYAWGFGETYQLASGTNDDNKVPRRSLGKPNEILESRVIFVSGGGQHAAIITAEPEKVNGHSGGNGNANKHKK